MGENKFLSAAVNLSRISNKVAIVVDYKKSIKLGKHTYSAIKLKFNTYVIVIVGFLYKLLP